MSIVLALLYVALLVLAGAALATVRFVVTQRFVARVRARTPKAVELQAERDRLYRETVLAEIAVARANDEAATWTARSMEMLRSLDKTHAAQSIAYGIIATLIGGVLLALIADLV